MYMYVCLAAGFLKVDIAERKPRFANGDVRSQDVTDGYLEEAYVVNGVLDPRVGREVTLDKACALRALARTRRTKKNDVHEPNSPVCVKPPLATLSPIRCVSLCLTLSASGPSAWPS